MIFQVPAQRGRPYVMISGRQTSNLWRKTSHWKCCPLQGSECTGCLTWKRYRRHASAQGLWNSSHLLQYLSTTHLIAKQLYFLLLSYKPVQSNKRQNLVVEEGVWIWCKVFSCFKFMTMVSNPNCHWQLFFDGKNFTNESNHDQKKWTQN